MHCLVYDLFGTTPEYLAWGTLEEMLELQAWYAARGRHPWLVFYDE